MRICALFVSVSLYAAAAVAQAQTVQLISNDEAKLPNATGQVSSRGITRGPGIKVLSPDPASKTVKGPFDLKIAFEPRGGSKIDASSATLTYLKNPPVDLTGRVKSGIKPEGIDVSKAAVPIGEHQIRVTVKDDEGRQTSVVLSLNVVN
jgi:hypothetical protein